MLRKIATSVLIALLFTLPAMAEERDENGRIIPGHRPIAHTDWVEIQREHASEEENEVDQIVGKASIESSDSKQEGFRGTIIQDSVYYTSHNGVYHSPIAVALMGGSVELEDGSVWKISNSDTYKTMNWLPTDLVVLSPNHDWFSTCLFRMSNQNTGVSVKCNLVLGPIYNGHYTHWIVAINYYTQEVFLEDGSIWQVSGHDSSIFSKWYLNDTIILGVNDGYLSSTKPNILINVNTLTFVRALCTW